MTVNPVPISSFFVGLHGLLAIALAYIVADERAKARIWHGSSTAETRHQPDPLENPSAWASFLETLTQKVAPDAQPNPEQLQRKIRAQANFSEYAPQGLLILIALELMPVSPALVWSLGICLAIARVAHAYGVIVKYGPSIGRAIGFFGTLLMFLVGSLACVYYAWGQF